MPPYRVTRWLIGYIDGLVQYCSNSIANALESPQSCTNASAYFTSVVHQNLKQLHIFVYTLHILCAVITDLCPIVDGHGYLHTLLWGCNNFPLFGVDSITLSKQKNVPLVSKFAITSNVIINILSPLPKAFSYNIVSKPGESLHSSIFSVVKV